MTIPASAQAHPIVASQKRLQWCDKDGYLTFPAQQLLDQWYQFIVNMNRSIPCNAAGTNVIALTFLPVAPLVEAYADFDVYSFVAANTSSGNVTANVTTSEGTLATLKVFKANGSAQAGSGDVVAGSHYTLTYVDSLDTAAGGFVLR